VAGFLTHVRAEGLSPHTERNYKNALAAWRRFCEATGRSLDPREVTRRDAEAFPIWLAEGGASDATRKNRHVVLSTFFKWLASPDEEVLESSPFAGLRAPKIGKRPVAVIPDDQVAALLVSVSGRSYEARRDRAVIMLLMSTGARRSEVAALLLEDVDVAAGRVTFHGKGNKVRVGAFGDATAAALRQFLRARDEHPQADRTYPVGDREDTRRIGRPLFLVVSGTGHRGALGGAGVADILRRRCAEAHVPAFNPHKFRHTWANAMLANGADGGDVMRLAGWESRQMLDRYTAYHAQERALVNYRDPLDSLIQGGRRGR
jgi:site-specific recombinase XerD